MTFTIKHYLTGAVLVELEAGSLKAALELAVRQGANLRDANLYGANLRDANLGDANLYGAKNADLTPVRDDLWAVLSASPAEVEGLRQALIDGRVDGSVYDGECACLLGTLANVRGCTVAELPGLKKNAGRPAEQWFLGINKGDTPKTNDAAKTALAWIDQWLANVRQLVRS
jgi:hypothetical protein